MRLRGPNGIVKAMPIGGVEITEDGDVWYDNERVAEIARDGTDVWLSCYGRVVKFSLAEGVIDEAGKEALAPMTGKVVAMPVKVGQIVKEGDTLAILEAMKMEYRLEAEADGEVEAINAEVGEFVDLGHVLVRLK
ncbi:MAG: acetyl-CoA carboxylase biotin carboxyl carrier protein subunit [Armatimonadota bacterium]|nr:acetyl-CoA carboxylase biotin carboxyl carrier protein subunit [Armatimonadota bacterium]